VTRSSSLRLRRRPGFRHGQRLATLARTARRRVWLLETLHQVNASIASSDDIELEFQRVVDEINVRFQFTRVSIGVVDGEMLVYRGYSAADPTTPARHPVGHGICGRVIRTGVGELVADVSRDPDYIRVDEEVTREIAVPLLVNGNVYGVLNVEATHNIPLGSEEFDVMRTLAISLGVAIERARQRRVEQRRLQHLAALQHVTGRIAGRVRVEQNFGDILAEIDRAFDFHGTTLGFLHGDELHFFTSYEDIVPTSEPSARLPISKGISGRVARTGVPAFIPDVALDPDFVRFREELTQEICVPVRVGGDIVGVLNIEMDDRRKIDEGDFDAALTIADHIGLAIANQRRIADLERRATQLRTVERVTAVIASKLVVQDAFRDILSEMELGFGFGTSAIGIIRGDRLIFPAIEVDDDGDSAAEHFSRHGIPLGRGITGTVALTGEPIFAQNVRAHPEYLATSPDVEYEICVPISVDGRTVGVLNVETTASRPLDHDDQEILTIIANHIGMAMHRGNLYRAERESRRAVEALQRVSNIVASTLSVNESLHLIVQTLKETFDFASVSIRLVEDGHLTLSADSDDRSPDLVDPLSLGQGVVGRVALTGIAEFIPDVTQEPAYIACRPEITSEICVPITHNGELAGVLNIEGDISRALTEQDLHLMRTFADYAGTLLNNAKLYEQMENLASHDAITGLPNYREFQERLREEVARSMRHERTLSLLVIDLNWFKQVNDEFGHLAGDEVLRAVGERLNSGLREGDVLARYAGDEFVVILPETGRADAHRIAERLADLVTADRFPIDSRGSARISLSVGMATFPDDAQDPIGLIRHADDAMYRAKRARHAQPLPQD
jgi:diguanylate cyclase (GGDEF)-like protein